MDIQELIEQIVSLDKKFGMFYFTMEDTTASMYKTAVDCRGKEVARCDYFGISTETKFIHKVDDAIVFLFDADIHMWELIDWNIRYDSFGGFVRTWNITLRR